MECRKCYGAVAEMIEPKDDEIARLTQQLSDAQAALKWWGDGKREELEAKLSVTQRQNAELIAALAPLAECYLPPQGYRHLGVTAHFRTEQITAACAALSASKVSNEVDGKD
jgi:hypothetical protein